MLRAIKPMHLREDRLQHNEVQFKVIKPVKAEDTKMKLDVLPVVCLVVLGSWIAMSLMNQSIFLKEALVSSFIIACLLFFRFAGAGSRGERIKRDTNRKNI